MSVIFSDTQASAYAYNKKSIGRLNLFNALPMGFLVEYGLSDKPSIKELTEATISFQGKKNLPIDGKLGPSTLKSILKKYAPVNRCYWTYNIVRSPASKNLNLIAYDQDIGLNLHDVGYFTPRHFVHKRPTQIVIHWGGLDPEHLYHCFSGNRKVSSHVGIGIVDGDPTVYQYLNLMHKAWHAGPANSNSIGVDICQQPDIKWLSRYKDLGYDIEVINNPSSRGSKQCLSLEPAIKEQLALALVDLCRLFNIPLSFPNTDQVLDDWKSFKGILGHHHISPRKWDCAPWFDDIEQAIRDL